MGDWNSSKYLPLGSVEQINVDVLGTIWGCVNDRFFIFGRTIPLRWLLYFERCLIEGVFLVQVWYLSGLYTATLATSYQNTTTGIGVTCFVQQFLPLWSYSGFIFSDPLWSICVLTFCEHWVLLQTCGNLNTAAARPVTLSIAYTFDFYIFIYLIYAQLAADGRLMYRPNSKPPSKLKINFLFCIFCAWSLVWSRIRPDVVFLLEFTVVLAVLFVWYTTDDFVLHGTCRLFEAILYIVLSLTCSF